MRTGPSSDRTRATPPARADRSNAMSHIVFGSGRAGVGVTTMVALVAGAAARRGGSDVVVVDLAGNGGLAPLLGRYAPTVRTLQDTADARMSTGNVRLHLHPL